MLGEETCLLWSEAMLMVQFPHLPCRILHLTEPNLGKLCSSSEEGQLHKTVMIIEKLKEGGRDRLERHLVREEPWDLAFLHTA